MAQRGADASDRSPGIRRSPIYKKDKKVVATVADPTKYTRTDASNQQEMRRADAADAALNKQRGYVQQVPVAGSTVVQDTVNTALNEQNPFTNAFGNPGGSGGSSGSGGSGFDINRAKLNEDKRQFDFSKAQTAEGRADAKAKFDALKNYYDTGGYKTGYNELNNIALGQYNTGVKGLQDTYDTAQKNLGEGYNTAQGLTDTGYTALENYLKQNPSNAYEGLQQQVQTVANPMEQFLSAYGVDNQPVQAQVAAEQLAGQQGAGAFNSLADILRRTSAQSDASRMAEMQMGRTMANSNLGAQRAGYQAQNAQAQAAALAQLQQALGGQQFGIQQNQTIVLAKKVAHPINVVHL